MIKESSILRFSRAYYVPLAVLLFLIFQVDPLFRIRRGESSASRFRHTPTQMEECTQYSAASFISWTWKLQYWLIDWTFACIYDWLHFDLLIDWFCICCCIDWFCIHWLIELELAYTDWFELAFGDVCALALTQCTVHPLWVVTIDWLIDCCGGLLCGSPQLSPRPRSPK